MFSKKKITTKRIIRILCLVLGIALLGHFLFWFLYTTVMSLKSSKEDSPSTRIMSQEYRSLFNKSVRNSLIVERTYNSKVRNQISLVQYDSLYSIIIYKIDLKKELILTEAVLKELKSVKQTSDVLYRGIPRNFMFKYKATPAPVPSYLYLTIGGDSIRTLISNDTLINYFTNFKNFSISDAKDGDKDIYAVSDDDAFITPTMPISILLLKRKASVYLLMMTANRDSTNLPERLLYNLVTGEK